MKNVIVVSSSQRKDGNSEILARRFAEGAIDAGNEVKFIRVSDVDLQFCTGCLYCQTHGKCVLNDKMNGLYDSFQNADVLVFATPVYYYSVSGQLKTFLDRLNPLYVRTNTFKEVYILATAAEDEKSAMDGAVTAAQGWVDCFEGVQIKGELRAVGVTEKGAVLATEFPETAYKMGKNV